MEPVNNNQFEVIPDLNKRKITAPSQNVYLNPALDLLANEDPMCNNAMEIVPIKKRKRARSCDITAFENTALDLGISKAAVNEFLVRELNNVKNNLRMQSMDINDRPSLSLPNTSIDKPEDINMEPMHSEPIYANINTKPLSTDTINNTTDSTRMFEIEENSKSDFSNRDSGISVLEPKNVTNTDISSVMNLSNITNIESTVTSQTCSNNTNNISLSFIDHLALDSPSVSNQSLYLDDDLNESNIMEIKTITIITKKKRIHTSNNTNPFLVPNFNTGSYVPSSNPFFDNIQPGIDYTNENLNIPTQESNLLPRKLFSDTNSTVSTENESGFNIEGNEYEKVDNYRAESPVYENIDETYNKQSKILGCNVSRFSADDIMNINKTSQSNNDLNVRKDIKHQLMKVKNKLSKKVFKSLKKTFRTEKVDRTSNPYEVPRKMKQKTEVPGIENPALRLDNSDEIEIEDVDEHEYESVKTLRNTQLNMNLTPLREKNECNLSHNKTYTPGKKVRFDSTLNQEKVITGNSFDGDIQSPGFDVKIDKYHDELENCINEKKFLQQNM